MQEIMRIGDQLVPADDDIKDIGHTGAEITDIAHKHKTDVLAVIGKGDRHTLVTRHHENDTELWQDVSKIIALIETTAKAYDTPTTDIVEGIKIIMEKGDEDGKE